jgi:hypothetical protein
MDEFAAFHEAHPAPPPKPERLMECPHCHKRVGVFQRRYMVHQDTPGMWTVLIEDDQPAGVLTFGIERQCTACKQTYSWRAAITKGGPFE